MSLLQDVLKANIEDIDGNGRMKRTRRISLEENLDSDDDLVNVVRSQRCDVFDSSVDEDIVRCPCQRPQLVPGHRLLLEEHRRGQSRDRSFYRQTAGIP
jgi:hypothetical protein